MRVFYLGFPGAMGGANTEMLHTIAVWRRAGIDVTLVPTWGTVGGPVLDKMLSLGCEVAQGYTAATIADVPGIAGSIVHSMCNCHFWEVFGTLKRLGCKTVWSSCMTFEFPESLAGVRQHGPADAYHFQSEFQRDEITATLAELGITVASKNDYRRDAETQRKTFLSAPLHFRGGFSPSPLSTSRGFLIRGAFDFTEFPFAPRRHEPRTDFVIGRLSRPEGDKWSSNLWPIINSVPYPGARPWRWAGR